MTSKDSTSLRPGFATLGAALGCIVAMGLWPAPASAQSQTDLLFHGSWVGYENSQVKNDGLVAGAYGTYGTGYRHLFEVGATWTGLDFTDGSTLDQWDVAGAYSRFWTRASGRIGGHYISTTDASTDGGFTLFGGANWYRAGSWSLGAEGAWSRFPDFGPALDASQISPSAGFTRTLSDGKFILGMTLRGYFIHLSQDAGLDDVDFASGEVGGSLTADRLTLNAFGWAGEQAFAVRNAGFLVFNLSELHTGGFGGGLRVVLSARSAFSAGYYVERFRELGFSQTSTARTVTASLGLTL